MHPSQEETKYLRKGKTISEIGGKPETYPSINAAKRKSRELQQTEGKGLGKGLVEVIR